MSLLYGAKFVSQETSASRPHIFGFQTPRSAAGDLLLDTWNASTSAGRKAAVDKDGKYYSAAWTAGDLPYVVAGVVTGVKRLDTLAIGTARKVLQVNAGATAPEWTSDLSVVTLATSGNATVSGVLAALGVSSEPILVVQRTVDAGAHQYSLRVDGFGNGYIRDDTRAAALLTFTAASGAATFAGLITANTGLTVASGQTLTLTGVTITGTPTWSSSQAITLSTAAQPNVTSLGTLTSLTVSGLITANGGLTVASGQTLTLTGATITGFSAATVTVTSSLVLTGATITGTPTWSSNQAITLSTAAQTNITSLGTLTALVVHGSLTVQAGSSNTDYKPILSLYMNQGLSTSNAGDTSLASTTIKGATLATSGAWIRITVEIAGAVAAETINIKFGATVIYTKTLAINATYKVVIQITRTGAATQVANATDIRIDSGAVTGQSTAPGETLSGDVTLDFRGNTTGSGTVYYNTISVEYGTT